MLNNKNTLLITLLFLFSIISRGQDMPFYNVALIPDSLLENANDVVRFENKVLKMRSSSEAFLMYSIAITILNKKSHNNVFAIYYDKLNKVKKIQAKVFDSKGKLIRKIPKDEIKDYSQVSSFSIYEDDRVKVLEINNNQYPYTVTFQYEKIVRGISLFSQTDWNIQEFNQSIQNASYILDVPNDLNVSYKTLNTDVEPVIEKNKGTKYLWEISKLKAKEKEIYGPPRNSILPELIVAIDPLETGAYRGSKSNWKDYGAYMYQLFKGRDKLSSQMNAEVIRLTQHAKSNKEKTERLYKYLQDNMRYVSVQLGIGGWQPFDAQYVEKNKYGDCKALSNFMKATLKVAGIEAYPVLIYWGNDKDIKITEEYTDLNFNHVVLYLPKEDMWLECTSNSYPPNYLGYEKCNRKALMVTPQGGKLIDTPKMLADENVEKNQATIQLSENGSAKVICDATYIGYDHERLRAIKNNFSDEEFEKWFRNSSDLSSFNIDKLDLIVSDKKAEAKLNYELGVSKYASKAAKRLFVPINKINPTKVVLKKNDNRKYPISISLGYSEIDEFQFILPEGYQLESMPKEKLELTSPFGNYILEVKQKEGKIICHRKLRINPINMPATRYDELRDFFKKLTKADQSKFVLVKKEIKP